MPLHLRKEKSRAYKRWIYLSVLCCSFAIVENRTCPTLPDMNALVVPNCPERRHRRVFTGRLLVCPDQGRPFNTPVHGMSCGLLLGQWIKALE